MGGEEGTSNVDAMDEGVGCEVENYGIRLENGDGDGNSDSDYFNGMRSDKGSKLDGMSSVSKIHEDGDCSGETASKLAGKAHFYGSNDSVRVSQSLSDDDSNKQGCNGDALKMPVEELYVCEEGKCKSMLRTAALPNGVHHDAVIGNGVIDESHCQGGNDICRDAFRDITHSEKFTTLGKVLLENFPGVKPDNLFSLSPINARLEDRAYETTPALFLVDVEQVWQKLQGIGAELIFLAKSLSDIAKQCFNEKVDSSDISKQCFNEKMGSSARCTPANRKHEDSASHLKSEQPESDGMYRDSFMARDMGSPHKGCVICERLNTGNTQCNQAGETSEDALKNGIDNGLQPSEISEVSCCCKICRSEVRNVDDLKVCEHSLCPNKYYHVKCLTSKQQKAYGPRWYCPSCLCRGCLTDKDDDQIVLCDGCDHAYHLYCMHPPRTSIPRGKWFCRWCHLKIQKIRRARKACDNYKSEVKKKTKMTHETPDEKLKVKPEGEKPDGCREGMDMLLNAALNYEEKLGSNQASTSVELKIT